MYNIEVTGSYEREEFPALIELIGLIKFPDLINGSSIDLKLVIIGFRMSANS